MRNIRCISEQIIKSDKEAKTMINLKNPFFDKETRTDFLRLRFSSEQIRELFNMFNLEYFIKG